MKKVLEGEQRKTFLENEGRFYAGTGHFSNSTKGFEALCGFEGLNKMGFGGRQDWASFDVGFKEVQDLRILVMRTKAKAQADNSFVMKELEGKGISFLREKVNG